MLFKALCLACKIAQCTVLMSVLTRAWVAVWVAHVCIASTGIYLAPAAFNCLKVQETQQAPGLYTTANTARTSCTLSSIPAYWLLCSTIYT